MLFVKIFFLDYEWFDVSGNLMEDYYFFVEMEIE